MAERAYPHNLEAERTVLGSILIDNAQFDVATGIVDDAHFYRDAHRRVFRAIKALHGRKMAIDVVTVADELARTGDLAEVDQLYVGRLIDGVPRAMNVEYYARIVREKAGLRDALNALRATERFLYEEAETTEQVIDRGVQSLLQITGAAPGDLVTGPALAKGALDWLDDLTARRGKRGTSGVPTGLWELDAMIDGFQPGDLVVVAARPSQGKSALALQFALAAAGPAAYFSLEMQRDPLTSRAIAQLARVDGWRLRRGRLHQAEYARVAQAAEEIAQSGLAIDDTAGLTVPQIRARALRHKARYGLDLIVVDYMQLLTPAYEKKLRDATREQEVARMSRGLKLIARDLNVPVIALSQLARAAENQSDEPPDLRHLRESGAIEQDADVVIFIHRRKGKTVKDEGEADLIIAKQRNGPTGTITLWWLPGETRFAPMAQQPAPTQGSLGE